jgi:hypothetical protein
MRAGDFRQRGMVLNLSTRTEAVLMHQLRVLCDLRQKHKVLRLAQLFHSGLKNDEIAGKELGSLRMTGLKTFSVPLW